MSYIITSLFVLKFLFKTLHTLSNLCIKHFLSLKKHIMIFTRNLLFKLMRIPKKKIKFCFKVAEIRGYKASNYHIEERLQCTYTKGYRFLIKKILRKYQRVYRICHGNFLIATNSWQLDLTNNKQVQLRENLIP